MKRITTFFVLACFLVFSGFISSTAFAKKNKIDVKIPIKENHSIAVVQLTVNVRNLNHHTVKFKDEIAQEAVQKQLLEMERILEESLGLKVKTGESSKSVYEDFGGQDFLRKNKYMWPNQLLFFSETKDEVKDAKIGSEVAMKLAKKLGVDYVMVIQSSWWCIKPCLGWKKLVVKTQYTIYDSSGSEAVVAKTQVRENAGAFPRGEKAVSKWNRETNAAFKAFATMLNQNQ